MPYVSRMYVEEDQCDLLDDPLPTLSITASKLRLFRHEKFPLRLACSFGNGRIFEAFSINRDSINRVNYVRYTQPDSFHNIIIQNDFKD
jgi:hypothetical protein